MAKVKLGFALPIFRGEQATSYADIRTLSKQADEAGLDSIWHADHFYIERAPNPKQPMLECWTVMTALAAETKSIRIGSLVLCQSFRHPSLLAKMAATLQDISDGRMLLGIGAGWHEAEYTSFGFPFDHRVGRFEEYLKVLVPLLANDTVSFSGKYYSVENAVLTPPSRPVPVWIASLSARMNGIAARVGNGWNGAWYGDNVPAFADRVGKLRALAAGQGREGAIEYSAGIMAIPVRSETEIPSTLAGIRKAMPMFEKLDDDRLLQRVMVGTPDAIAGMLRRFTDAGADTVIVTTAPTPFGHWSDEANEMLINEVSSRVI